MSGDRNEDEDDVAWVSYSSAGYGSAEDDLWDDVVPMENQGSELDWYDDSPIDEDPSTQWDAPPCPAPLGVAHLIRIGCCNHCLYRLAGKKTKNSGPLGGEELRKQAIELNSDLREIESLDHCPTCEDLMDDVHNISEIISDACQAIDFRTMQIGVHIPKDLMEEEDAVRSRYGAPGSNPLKATFVEEIQATLQTNSSDIEFVRERPDVMILIDTLTLRVEVDVRPVFIYGRYIKNSREIPQTRWPCRSCRGRKGGCEACESSGLQYLDSVQDLIGRPFVTGMGALDTAFHGMGREDIYVRCLGGGRPFVLEVKSPRSRSPELSDYESIISSTCGGRVEVNSLRFSDRKEVARIKQTRSEKTYTIRFSTKETIDKEKATSLILSLSGVVVEQQTPKRVSHRRADKNRKRRIISVDEVNFDGEEIEVTLRCEAGTYIKELVHSDEGRTNPSVAGVLETACEVIWLDVENVHAD